MLRQEEIVFGSLYQSVIGYRPPLEMCSLLGLSGEMIPATRGNSQEKGAAASCLQPLITAGGRGDCG